MIVFDSSTLILLAKIDALDLFVLNYGGRAVVPDAVMKEVTARDCEESPRIAGLIAGGKIGVSRADDKKLARKLMDDFNIDAGEAEAIALALGRKGAAVATDDRNAIRACKLLRIDFITAIAVLIRAFEKKLLSGGEALLKLERLESAGRYKRPIILDARKRMKGGG